MENSKTKYHATAAGATQRRLAAIAHDHLNRQRYDSVADLAEDVKRAAARQRIPYDSAAISATLARVGSARPLARLPI